MRRAQEMALKLGDAVIRRTEAGAAGHPGADALERAAAIMARAHGWDEWRMRNEIAEVEAFYQAAERLSSAEPSPRETPAGPRASARRLSQRRIHAFS